MITVGGINFTAAIVNLEFEVQRTQRILDWVLQNNPGLSAIPREALDKIAADSLKFVQEKYPSAGVSAAKSEPFLSPDFGMTRRP